MCLHKDRIVILCARIVVCCASAFVHTYTGIAKECISCENSGYFPQFRIFYHRTTFIHNPLFSTLTQSLYVRLHNKCVAAPPETQHSHKTDWKILWTNPTLLVPFFFSSVLLFVYFVWYANIQWLLVWCCKAPTNVRMNKYVRTKLSVPSEIM